MLTAMTPPSTVKQDSIEKSLLVWQSEAGPLWLSGNNACSVKVNNTDNLSVSPLTYCLRASTVFTGMSRLAVNVPFNVVQVKAQEKAPCVELNAKTWCQVCIEANILSMLPFLWFKTLPGCYNTACHTQTSHQQKEMSLTAEKAKFNPIVCWPASFTIPQLNIILTGNSAIRVR